MPLPQLSGQIYVDETNDGQEIARLKRQVSQLDEALRLKRLECDQILFGVRGLQRVLEPFRKYILAVFGELDSFGLQDQDAPSAVSSRWDHAKKQLGGKHAVFIELLQAHGTMNITNFTTLGRCAKPTAYSILEKLTNAGITEKVDRGKWGLKES